MLIELYYWSVLAALGIGAIYRPATAFVALAGQFAIEQLGMSSIAFVSGHGSFTNWVCLGISAVAAARQSTSGQYGLVITRTHILVVLLYLYAGVSTAWSIGPTDVLLQQWKESIATILASIFLLPAIVRNSEDLYLGLRSFMWFGLVTVPIAVFSLDWGDRGFLSQIVSGDVIAVPLALATFGSYLFVIAVMLARATWKSSISALMLAALSLRLIWLTETRGQLLFAILAVAALFPFLRLRRGLRWAVLALETAILVLVLAFYQSELTSLFQGQGGRWEAAAVMRGLSQREFAIERIFNAYQSGGLMTIVFGLGNSSSFSDRVVGIYSHNLIVEIVCELGVIGAVVFFLIVAASIRNMCSVARRIQERSACHVESRAFGALMALLLLEFLISMKQGSLLGQVWVFAFVILLEHAFRSTDVECIKEKVGVGVRKAGRQEVSGS